MRSLLCVVCALAVAGAAQAASAKSLADQARAMIGPQPKPASLKGVSAHRQKIVKTAASYIGKVIDIPGPDGKKVGWKTLEEIYRTAMGMPANWPTGPLKNQLDNPSGGVPLTVQPVAWCGLFATFAVKKAGFNLKWVAGLGPKGGSRPIAATEHTWANIQPGDIVVIKDADPAKPLTHHALVEHVDLKKGTIQTIDGNMTLQQIYRKTRQLSQIRYYYDTLNDGGKAKAKVSAKGKPAAKKGHAAAQEASDTPAAAADDDSAPSGSLVEKAHAMIGPQPPPADLSSVSPERQKIVKTAESYIGKVIDLPGPGGKKFGYQTLIEIYRTAMGMPASWPNGPLLKQLENPSGGKDLTVQPVAWCGLFATFAVRKAGFNLKWVAGLGPKGGSRPIPATKATWAKIQPGDIVVIKDADPSKPLTHHALVEMVDLDGGKIQTIDGNMTLQQIYRKTRSLTQIKYFYDTLNDSGKKTE